MTPTPIVGDPQPVEVIDAAHLTRQREWSKATFGPGKRTLGVIDHIRKELAEVEADPTDLSEWVDIIILAFDGAWRHGGKPQQIIDAIVAKQARNEARTWPDWRTASPDHAIEHDRAGDAMSGDIVERLREWADMGGERDEAVHPEEARSDYELSGALRDAADEIERLRAVIEVGKYWSGTVDRLATEVDRVRAQRDAERALADEWAAAVQPSHWLHPDICPCDVCIVRAKWREARK